MWPEFVREVNIDAVGQWFLGLIGSVTMVGLAGVGFINNRISKMEKDCEDGIDKAERNCEAAVERVAVEAREAHQKLRADLVVSVQERQRQYELLIDKFNHIPTREEVREDRVDMETRLMAAIKKYGNGNYPS